MTHLINDEGWISHAASSLKVASTKAQNWVPTWQVIGALELVSDVPALKNLQDQLVPFCLHLLLQSNLDLSHHLGFTT